MSPVQLKNPQPRIACQTYLLGYDKCLQHTWIRQVFAAFCKSVSSVTGQETRAVQVQATCIIFQII